MFASEYKDRCLTANTFSLVVYVSRVGPKKDASLTYKIWAYKTILTSVIHQSQSSILFGEVIWGCYEYVHGGSKGF